MRPRGQGVKALQPAGFFVPGFFAFGRCVRYDGRRESTLHAAAPCEGT